MASILARTAAFNLTAIPARSLHSSAAVVAEEKRGLFSRLNPFAKKSEPEQSQQKEESAPAQSLEVEIKDKEYYAPPSWKGEYKDLTEKELADAVRTAAATVLDTPITKLRKVDISQPAIKFKVLKACMVETGHEIPNKDLNEINTLRDVVHVLHRNSVAAKEAINPKGHAVAEWFARQQEQNNLPDNVVFIPYKKERGIPVEDRRTPNKRFL
ncbi:hypothetical protein BGW42_000265 [Actinomortierella wolfii]|nr:hypothetical protein BGW42_000265 [Actinomortierella wolfii]